MQICGLPNSEMEGNRTGEDQRRLLTAETIYMGSGGSPQELSRDVAGTKRSKE